LARNPCRNVNLPPVEGTRRFDLTPEDAAGIATHVSEEYRPMIWIGAALGLRWSEVAALRVGRLDLDAGRLAVAEAGAGFHDLRRLNATARRRRHRREDGADTTRPR
jgi:integrase